MRNEKKKEEESAREVSKELQEIQRVCIFYFNSFIPTEFQRAVQQFAKDIQNSHGEAIVTASSSRKLIGLGREKKPRRGSPPREKKQKTNDFQTQTAEQTTESVPELDYRPSDGEAWSPYGQWVPVEPKEAPGPELDGEKEEETEQEIADLSAVNRYTGPEKEEVDAILEQEEEGVSEEPIKPIQFKKRKRGAGRGGARQNLRKNFREN